MAVLKKSIKNLEKGAEQGAKNTFEDMYYFTCLQNIYVCPAKIAAFEHDSQWRIRNANLYEFNRDLISLQKRKKNRGDPNEMRWNQQWREWASQQSLPYVHSTTGPLRDVHGVYREKKEEGDRGGQKDKRGK